MTSLSRLNSAVIAAGALLSVLLIAPPAATADPVEYKQDFALHFRSDETQCMLEPTNFGKPGSTCDVYGNFDSGHPPTPSGTAPDFLDVRGHVRYTGGSQGTPTFVELRSRDGLIRGTIPSRGSDQFTITQFHSPSMSHVAAVGQTIKLNVQENKPWYSPNGFYDFYLAGDLPFREPEPCPPSPFPSPIGPCSTPPIGPQIGGFGSS